MEIELKGGKRRMVADRTGIYVDQAWVGRGKYGREPDHRARGQIYIMRPPFTSGFFFPVFLVAEMRVEVEARADDGLQASRSS